MDSTEDENTRWHVAGFGNRVKMPKKTQKPTIMLRAVALLPQLLKLNNLKVATGPKRVWAMGSL